MTTLLWMSVIGSTLSWAAFDAVRKKLVTKIPVAALAFWIALAQLPGYIAWAFIEGKLSLSSGYFQPAALSVSLNLLANVLFLEAVRRGPLSVAIPVLSFTPVFVALGSIPLLGERLGALQWLGVAVVTAASVFLTTEPGQSLRPDRLIARFAKTAGVPHMFGVAVLWSLTPIFDKLALRHAGVGIHGTIMAAFGAAGMLGYLALRRQKDTLALPPRSLGLLSLGGLTNVAALGLQLVAITQMVVSVFEAFKRAAGVLLALAIGALLFREKVSATRALAAAFMAAGVVFVLRG